MTHVLPFERRGEPVGEVGEVASNEQQTYRGISDMATANLDKATLKLALKEALAETLHEQP